MSKPNFSPPGSSNTSPKTSVKNFFEAESEANQLQGSDGSRGNMDYSLDHFETRPRSRSRTDEDKLTVPTTRNRSGSFSDGTLPPKRRDSGVASNDGGLHPAFQKLKGLSAAQR